MAALASLRNRQQPRQPIILRGKTKVTVPLPPAVVVFRGAVAASRLARHEPQQPIILRGSVAQWPGPKSFITLAAAASLRNRQQPRQPLVNVGPDNTFIQPCPYRPARPDDASGYIPARVDAATGYVPALVPQANDYIPARVPGCGG
jgi:hypothetical protein